MKKKVVIIGVNYYPEDTAIGLYTTQKAEYLASNGFDVSVITGFPYYPQWEISKLYTNKKRWLLEQRNGVAIYRYKLYVPKEPTFKRRILHLLSFTIGSFFNIIKVSKPDIAICIIPFTSSIVLGLWFKLRYKSKLWLHIQDFEFDAAIDSGLLNQNKSLFVRILLKLEQFLFARADIISTISNSMLKKLENKSNFKGYYLTNWLDFSVFNKNVKAHRYLTSEKFKILYSGNIGAKQDWEFFIIFVDAIKEIENIEVIVVGEGALKNYVVENTKQYNFITHHVLVPFEELPSLLKSADLHILFQKDDVVDTVMPSKILGMMGSGKPSIITGNEESEVKKIIESSNGGFYYHNNQLTEMISTINFLKENILERQILGSNAKKFVEEHYSKAKVLGGFLKKINSL